MAAPKNSSSRPKDCKQDDCEVRPILTCVVQHDDAHFTAVFGYKNNSVAEVRIPVGKNNTFDADQEDRGQPISFRPGQHRGVFDVEFSEKLVWRVGKEVATASARSPRCSLQCPPDQGLDQDGQCLPIEQNTDRVVKE